MDDCEQIKNTVLEFILDLKDNIFTNEKGDLMLVEFFFRKMSEIDIANQIVKHVLPYKNRIENREIEFFNEKKGEIFKGLPVNRVEYFSQLITKDESNGGMSEENKEIVWSYFDALVLLAERYKKNK